MWLFNNVKIYYLARVIGVAWGIHCVCDSVKVVTWFFTQNGNITFNYTAAHVHKKQDCCYMYEQMSNKPDKQSLQLTYRNNFLLRRTLLLLSLTNGEITSDYSERTI